MTPRGYRCSSPRSRAQRSRCLALALTIATAMLAAPVSGASEAGRSGTGTQAEAAAPQVHVALSDDVRRLFEADAGKVRLLALLSPS